MNMNMNCKHLYRTICDGKYLYKCNIKNCKVHSAKFGMIKEACENMNPPISFLPNYECHFAYNGIDLNTCPCHE